MLTLLVFLSNVYVIRCLGAERFGEFALFQVYLALSLTSRLGDPSARRSWR